MISHAVAYHGTGTTMSRVLLSGAHSVYVGCVPCGPEQPQQLGELLTRLQLSQHGGLVIGVRTPDGEELINPPKTTLLAPDAQLIYLAEKPLLDPP